jgi:hypothetical protein
MVNAGAGSRGHLGSCPALNRTDSVARSTFAVCRAVPEDAITAVVRENNPPGVWDPRLVAAAREDEMRHFYDSSFVWQNSWR